MVHGDDNGLVIPPKLAPIQIIIIPIFVGKSIDKKIEKKAQNLKEILKDLRVEIDKRKEYSIGWKFNEWELKGVPLRIEIGQKEIKEDRVTLVRRDIGEKYSAPLNNLASKLKEILKLIQENLFKKSRKYLKENTREVLNYKEFKEIIKRKRGFLKAFWCENPQCEKKIKEETKATTRVLPINAPIEKGKCIYCGKSAQKRWVFAQAY